MNETGDEICLYSLRLSEIALAEQEKKVFKNSVPFDYTSFVLFRFGGENFKYRLVGCLMYVLPDKKYQHCFAKACTRRILLRETLSLRGESEP